MRALFLLILVLATTQARAEIVMASFFAPSLGRAIEYAAILPRGHERMPALPYAIFLHGRGGNRTQLLELGAEAALDAKPFVIIMPSGGDHYWMNAAISKEKWGDVVTKDLVAHVEKTYRVLRDDPRARALFGISMGGHGVVQLGYTAPNVFATGAAMSPVFRREQDIWRPGSEEPRSDYEAFGEGADYQARSPRHHFERTRRLPFANFNLEMGPEDDLLDHYPDTRALIDDFARAHPRGAIGLVGVPRTAGATENENGHTYAYWRARLPVVLKWLEEKLTSRDPRRSDCRL